MGNGGHRSGRVAEGDEHAARLEDSRARPGTLSLPTRIVDHVALFAAFRDPRHFGDKNRPFEIVDDVVVAMSPWPVSTFSGEPGRADHGGRPGDLPTGQGSGPRRRRPHGSTPCRPS